jgi:hypothetical protein
MSEWWTYRLSDFLMFAPRTYYRLFELYNAGIWPLHIAAFAVGLAVLRLVWRGGAASGRIACAQLAIVWLFIAWAYHWERYATINWASAYYAAGFAIEALLLSVAAVRGAPIARPAGARGFAALPLLLVGIVLYPLIAPFSGRPWVQAETFGIAPDPTAIATLGVALLVTGRYGALLGVLPLLWCVVSALTLWTMDSPEAAVPAVAAVVALIATQCAKPLNLQDMDKKRTSQ